MTANAESTPNGKLENDANSIMSDVKETLEDSIADTRAAVDSMTQEASKELRKVTDQTTTFVRENPGVALLGAVGVGVVVGLALRSR